MPVATRQGGVDRTSPYSVNELLALAHFVGFHGQAQSNIVAIALSESGGNPNATNVNTDGSRDRGLYQINDRFHPDVSDACAYDPVCSTQAAWRLSNQGKTFSPNPWNAAVDNWPSHLAQVEQAQRAGGWKQFQTQFASDTGVASSPSSQGAASTTQQGGKHLFDCSSGGVTTSGIGPLQIPTGGSFPDVGCYLKGSMEVAMYAIGGLLLIGAGLLLLARKNPVKVGVKGTMAAVAPEAYLGSKLGRAPAARPLSANQQLAQQRETRIAGRQQATDPVRLSRARAEASKIRAQAAAQREATAGAKARRKYGAAAGLSPQTKTILGVEVPQVEVPGFDASSMVG